MNKWLLNIAWVLLGLLGISAFVISAGDKQEGVNPASSSYGSSGTSALAELLRTRGYDVVVDGHERPKLQKGDVVLGFLLHGETFSANNDWGDVDQIQKTRDAINGQVGKGGLAFWLPIDRDFETVSSNAAPTSFNRIDGKPRSLTNGNLGPDPSFDSGSMVALVKDKDQTFVSGEKVGDAGYQIDYENGIGLTNRFIDKGDNAQTFIELLKTYAPDARRIVFANATFGQITKVGFLETLGPWAEGTWYQFLFFLAIVMITLNQRFGLPIRLRKKQVGNRELLDALADTMLRAKATGMSLESAYKRADTKVRRIVKLPRDASEGERDRVLPEKVLIRLKEVKAASQMERVRPSDALTLVVKLEDSVNEFASASGVSQMAPKRRKKSA